MMALPIVPSPLTLAALLRGWAEPSPGIDVPLTGLALDSRCLSPGGLFLACSGERAHGLDYLDQALLRQPAAVAFEPDARYAAEQAALLQQRHSLPFLPVEDLRRRAGAIAARFYGDPSVDLEVIGITGTNGKTSCSHFLAQALGEDWRVIGTLGHGRPGALEETGHTTPDPVGLQQILAGFRDQGAAGAALEVSSHALDQGRADAVRLRTAALTNFSQDHLDYHGDMAAYAAAKKRLFEQPGLEAAVLNLDDPLGRELLEALSVRQPGLALLGYSSAPLTAEMRNRLAGWAAASEIEVRPEGLRLRVATQAGEGELVVPLLGRFNAENLLLALTVLLRHGHDLEDALQRLRGVQTVPGRMEPFSAPGQPLAVVDYAHTPDALEKALRDLRPHCRGRLWCLFGCGGDRDRAKRPLMGAVAEALADRVVLTDDNPRSEDGGAIVEAVLSGMQSPAQHRVERNRGRAIEQTLAAAGPEDLVLIAGKGHETTQQVGDLMTPFSDRQRVGEWLEGLGR